MPSLKAIRTRIASVKNTQKITKAMKLVAAAKLRRAQDADRRRAPVRAAAIEVLGDVTARAALEAADARRRIRCSTQRPSKTRRARRHHLATAACAGGFNSNLAAPPERFIVDEKDAAIRTIELARSSAARAREYFGAGATRARDARDRAERGGDVGHGARARARARRSRRPRSSSTARSTRSAGLQRVQERDHAGRAGRAAPADRAGEAARRRRRRFDFLYEPSQGRAARHAAAAVRRDRSSTARCSSRSPRTSARA